MEASMLFLSAVIYYSKKKVFQVNEWRVAKWLASCAWKLKVPGSSLPASYVQMWTLCSNRPANV